MTSANTIDILNEAKSCFKEFIGILVENHRKEISDIRKENLELQKSLEFSQKQIEDLTRKVEENSKNLQALRKEHELLPDIDNRLRQQEDQFKIN